MNIVKIYYKAFFLFLVLFLGSAKSHCQNIISAGDEQITGAWQMDGTSTMAEMDKVDKETMGSRSQKERDIMVGALDSRKFVFMKDGRFHASWAIEGKEFFKTGDWKKNGDKLSLTFDGISNEYLIREFSGKKMVLQPLAKGRGMIKVLVFYKTN